MSIWRCTNCSYTPLTAGTNYCPRCTWTVFEPTDSSDPRDAGTKLDPGYIADHVRPGDTFTVTLPDGSVRAVVVLSEFKSGGVTIDFVDRLKAGSARAAELDGKGD